MGLLVLVAVVLPLLMAMTGTFKGILQPLMCRSRIDTRDPKDVSWSTTPTTIIAATFSCPTARPPLTPRGCTGALLSTAVTSNTTGTPDDFGRKRATTSGATDPSIKYFAVAQALFHILLAFADIKRDRRATLVARQWVLKVGPGTHIKMHFSG